ncbi:hypothetical protein X943_003680 [Babesia divergens]|uniref:Uncharacterized protein n=1 Tax=Babesia divergens TaxID=32595 RepID=A0AAD9GJW6_BABDI|nr:hypothetical protein X943_003680 [Babesia divergens]
MMESSRQIFYLLELDLTTADNRSKTYIYAGVAGRDYQRRLCRVRNIYDWESEVYQASKLLTTGRKSISRNDDGNVRLIIERNSTNT